MNNSRLIIVMGVAGTGKTTIAKELARELNLPFLEGDEFHPEANVLKMKSGEPLTDEDRYGWLHTLNGELISRQHTGVVLSCSALKEAYRDILSFNSTEPLLWVYLKGDYELVLKRMKSRSGHFMPPALLQSQFAILEEPKEAITVDIGKSPQEIVTQLLAEIKKGT